MVCPSKINWNYPYCITSPGVLKIVFVPCVVHQNVVHNMIWVGSYSFWAPINLVLGPNFVFYYECICHMSISLRLAYVYISYCLQRWRSFQIHAITPVGLPVHASHRAVCVRYVAPKQSLWGKHAIRTVTIEIKCASKTTITSFFIIFAYIRLIIDASRCD